MSRKILAAVAVTVALAASVAYAHAPLTCTPGFWKNHLLEAHGPNPALCPSPDTLINCTNTPGFYLGCAQTDPVSGGAVCTCEELVFFTSAELGATAVERAAAQGCLNIVAQDQLGITIVCE
jgi:hypothetical protein